MYTWVSPWVCAHLCQVSGTLAPLELELQVVMSLLLATQLYKIRMRSDSSSVSPSVVATGLALNLMSQQRRP